MNAVQGQPAIEEVEQEQVDGEVLRAFLEKGYQRWEDLQVRIRALDAEEGSWVRPLALAQRRWWWGWGAWPPCLAPQLLLWDGRERVWFVWADGGLGARRVRRGGGEWLCGCAVQVVG